MCPTFGGEKKKWTFCPPPPLEDDWDRCQRTSCCRRASAHRCHRCRLGEPSGPGESQAADAGRGRAGENHRLGPRHSNEIFHKILVWILLNVCLLLERQYCKKWLKKKEAVAFWLAPTAIAKNIFERSEIDKIVCFFFYLERFISWLASVIVFGAIY